MNADKWEKHFFQKVVAEYDGQIMEVMVGEQKLDLVVASTHESRVRGLSQHTEMPHDGMLFIYDSDHNAMFTAEAMNGLDVSIWFFDADGADAGSGWDLQSDTAKADGPYRYVVETYSTMALAGRLKMVGLVTHSDD